MNLVGVFCLAKNGDRIFADLGCAEIYISALWGSTAWDRREAAWTEERFMRKYIFDHSTQKAASKKSGGMWGGCWLLSFSEHLVEDNCTKANCYYLVGDRHVQLAYLILIIHKVQ